VLFLLLFAAEFEQGGTEHHHAHAADRIPRADAVHFLLQHTDLGLTEPTAAILLGIGGATPALLTHRLFPPGEVGARVRAVLTQHHAAATLERGREVLL